MVIYLSSPRDAPRFTVSLALKGLLASAPAARAAATTRRDATRRVAAAPCLAIANGCVLAWRRKGILCGSSTWARCSYVLQDRGHGSLCDITTLPENPNLPSVSAFTECQTAGIWQRRGLPSARPRALGKNVAHGMPTLRQVLAVGKVGHSAKINLCRVPPGPHSAKTAHVPSTRARRAPAVRMADGI